MRARITASLALLQACLSACSAGPAPAPSAAAPTQSTTATLHAQATTAPLTISTAPPTEAPTTTPSAEPPTFPGFDVSLDGVLRLPTDQKTHFRTDSPEILPESDPGLETVRKLLTTYPSITLLRIEGHTDHAGNQHHSRRLSQARAMAVAAWLVAHGIGCARLLAVGFGDERPIECENCQDGRRPSRRIEFHVAMVKGEAPFGPPEGGGRPAGDPCKPEPLWPP